MLEIIHTTLNNIMTKNCEFLLNHIILTAKEEYQVFDLVEISNDFNLSIEEINNCLLFLKTNNYIVVKYNDGKTLCTLVTEKALNYVNESSCLEEKNTHNGFKGLAGLCFFASFLGGIVGSIIIQCLIWLGR